MSEEEIWRRWKASQQSSHPIVPGEYREIDELEVELEVEIEYAPQPRQATLRYPDADLEKLRTEAEEMLRQNRAVSAADLFEQALLLFESSPRADEVMKGQLLGGLGRAQHQKGDRQEAEETLGRALEIARREQDGSLEQKVRYGLGLVYLKTRRHALASDNLRQALVRARQQQDERGEARILRELGAAYLGQSMLHKAVACLITAQKLYTRIELFADYEERKQADRAIADLLEEVRKQAEKVNYSQGARQYQSWVAEAETGKLLPE